jgi:putative hydrolase of HD superfamily
MPGQDDKLRASLVYLSEVCLAFGRTDRATFHPDGVTPESDTDHTVMLGIVAAALAARLYPHLDRGLIAQFALVHDLVEVHVGDTPTLQISAAGLAEKEAREDDALHQLEAEFGPELPWVPDTIRAYEGRASAEARFVKTVDKLLPKVLVGLTGGATLATHGMTAVAAMRAWNDQRAAMEQSYAAEFPEVLALTDALVAGFPAAAQARARRG